MESRTTSIYTRVTPQEKQKMARTAKRCGLSLSANPAFSAWDLPRHENVPFFRLFSPFGTESRSFGTIRTPPMLPAHCVR